MAALLDPRLQKQKDVKLLQADLSDRRIQMIEIFVELMKYMYDVTLVIFSERSLTAGLILPLLTRLLNVFKPEDDDRGYRSNLKMAVTATSQQGTRQRLCIIFSRKLQHLTLGQRESPILRQIQKNRRVIHSHAGEE